MVTQNELKAFYEIELKPKLLFFEEQRKRLVSKRKPLIIYGILVIFAILTMKIAGNLETRDIPIVMTPKTENMGGIVEFAIIIYLIAITIAIANFYLQMKSSYQAHFKKAIVGSLVTFIDQNLSYAPDKTISVDAFHTSQLFKQEYGYWGVDKFTSEDYVGGILDGTSVKFSEVHAQEEQGHGESSEYVTVFKGLFFIFDVNWDFEGITFILPNDGELSVKKLLQLLKLAKPTLEREFIVHSDNPIIANYVFSTAFMQRLLALRRRLKTPIYLSFVKGKLYMAIPVSEDLFEPPIFSTVLDFQFIQTTFEYMQLGKVIVEELLTLMKQPQAIPKK